MIFKEFRTPQPGEQRDPQAPAYYLLVGDRLGDTQVVCRTMTGSQKSWSMLDSQINSWVPFDNWPASGIPLLVPIIAPVRQEDA